MGVIEDVIAQRNIASGTEFADQTPFDQAIFTAIVGRDPTQGELDLLNNQWGTYGVQSHTNKVQDLHYRNRTEVVNAYKGVLDKASTYAGQVAAANGFDLSPEQLQSLASQFIDPSQLKNSALRIDSVQNESLDKIKDFLVAGVNRLGTEAIRNPNINDQQIADVQRIFQNVYGRAADADEAQYFAQELASGKSKYELSQELMSLPEYQRVQAEKDRSALDQELRSQQAEVFRRAQPQIISSFMRAGRLNSSGLNAALASAQRDLERERQGALAQIGAQDAATIRANAFQDFLRRDQPYQMGRMTFNPAAQYQMQFGLTQQGIARQRELEDYYRQASDYNRYLSEQRKGNREAALYGLGGAALGAGLQGLTYGLAR